MSLEKDMYVDCHFPGETDLFPLEPQVSLCWPSPSLVGADVSSFPESDQSCPESAGPEPVSEAWGVVKIREGLAFLCQQYRDSHPPCS